jgi:O-antigen/teichoic acid export membrane protein
VVLNVLGVEDYGIYNVVAGLTVIMSFLNSAMSNSISRFISVELGIGNTYRQRRTFETVRTIILILCIIFLIIAETAGLWMVINKLIIPDNRIYAAIIAYQLSVANAILQMTQIPYTAIVISYERMNVFAVLEIIASVLKLAGVYVLLMFDYDKLIIYGILLCCITIVINICYRIYCFRNFNESKSFLCMKKEYMKPILSFALFESYGNFCSIMRSQGVNVLLNMFFGPIINTANGIAMQIQGATGAFSSNLLAAFRPQIVINYTKNDKKQMIKYMHYAAKYGFLMVFMIGMPLFLEMSFVLKAWLVNVPEYTVDFARMTLLSALFGSITNAQVSGIHATGRIKTPTLVIATYVLSVIPISYIFFKLGFSPLIPFIVNASLIGVNIICNLFFLRHYIKEFFIHEYLTRVILPCFCVSLSAVVLPLVLMFIMNTGFLRLFLVIAASIVSTTVFSLFFAIENDAKIYLKKKMFEIPGFNK